MLKYKSVSSDNKIAVSYNDWNTFFTKDFIFAFSIAIFLHLSFLFLFSIKDIGLLFPYQPATLVFNVDSDLILNELSVDTTSLSQEKFVPEPPYEDFFLADLPSFAMEKNFDDSMQHLQGIILNYEEDVEKKLLKERVEIFLCHELAGKKMVWEKNFVHISENGYAKFSVQIENLSGKIIWSELNECFGGKAVQQQAKQLLSTIAFEPSIHDFATLGEVEIFFND